MITNIALWVDRVLNRDTALGVGWKNWNMWKKKCVLLISLCVFRVIVNLIIKMLFGYILQVFVIILLALVYYNIVYM